MDASGHLPVMVDEVLELIRPHDGGIYFDGTVGMGGHARAILEASSPSGVLIGSDLDPGAVDAARHNLGPFGTRAKIFHANYSEIAYTTRFAGASELSGVLLDLGLGSHQLGDTDRGFSIERGGPLDMRFDTGRGVPAEKVVNRASEKELAAIIGDLGEEPRARAAARAIVRERQKKRIEDAKELAAIVARAIGPPGRWRIHPATRTFMALRIFVNDELVSLTKFIPEAARWLAPGGVMVIISFHSLEDRIVKNSFRELVKKADGTESSPFALMTKKPVTPGQREVATNPRARSAKLRAVQRIPDG